MSYAINLTTPGGIELFRTKTHTWLFGAGATLNPDRVETYGDRTTAERIAEHIEADKRQQYGTDWHARAVRWAIAALVLFGTLAPTVDNAEARGRRGASSGHSGGKVSGGKGGLVSICSPSACPIFSATDQMGVVIYTYKPDKTHDPIGETPEVAAGLQAPEGSELRHKAELCMVLGKRAQRECMAYKPKFER